MSMITLPIHPDDTSNLIFEHFSRLQRHMLANGKCLSDTCLQRHLLPGDISWQPTFVGRRHFLAVETCWKPTYAGMRHLLPSDIISIVIAQLIFLLQAIFASNSYSSWKQMSPASKCHLLEKFRRPANVTCQQMSLASICRLPAHVPCQLTRKYRLQANVACKPVSYKQMAPHAFVVYQRLSSPASVAITLRDRKARSASEHGQLNSFSEHVEQQFIKNWIQILENGIGPE